MPDAREQLYQEMIREFPEDPLGYFSLGKYYVEVERFQDAIAPLERCIEHDPNWAVALLELSNAYAGSGDKTRAISLLERASKTPHAQRHGVGRVIETRLKDLSAGAM